MCHQSVGLVQGAIEAAGIATISLTVRPEITINLRVPRAAYVRFPTGNPVGQPHMPHQQRTILRGVLRALETIDEPGTVLEMPYRWKRMPVEDVGAAPPTRVQTPFPQEDGERSVYGRARAHVETLERRYAEIMEAVDAYRRFLDEVSGAEAARQPDQLKLQAIGPQLTYLGELQHALEGPAHDGLVRVADRVVRIRHWEEGVFL